MREVAFVFVGAAIMGWFFIITLMNSDIAVVQKKTMTCSYKGSSYRMEAVK